MDHLPHNISQLFGKCSNHHIFDHLRQKGPKLLIAVASLVPFCSHSFHRTRPKRPWLEYSDAMPAQQLQWNWTKKTWGILRIKGAKKIPQAMADWIYSLPSNNGKWRFLEIPHVIMQVGGWSKASLKHVITISICFKKSNGLGTNHPTCLTSISILKWSGDMSRFGQNQQGTLRIWGVGALGESAQQFGMTWLWPKVSSDWHGYGTLFDWSANIFPWWRCQPKSYDLYVCITYVRVKYEDMNTPQAEFSVQTGDFQLSVKTDFC